MGILVVPLTHGTPHDEPLTKNSRSYARRSSIGVPWSFEPSHAQTSDDDSSQPPQGSGIPARRSEGRSPTWWLAALWTCELARPRGYVCVHPLINCHESCQERGLQKQEEWKTISLGAECEKARCQQTSAPYHCTGKRHGSQTPSRKPQALAEDTILPLLYDYYSAAFQECLLDKTHLPLSVQDSEGFNPVVFFFSVYSQQNSACGALCLMPYGHRRTLQFWLSKNGHLHMRSSLAIRNCARLGSDGASHL